MKVDGFWIDRHEVTNSEFAQFIEATGYKTLAERGINPNNHPGMSGNVLEPGSVSSWPRPNLVAVGTSLSGGNT